MRHQDKQRESTFLTLIRSVWGNVRPGRLVLTLFYAGAAAVCGWQTMVQTGRYSRGFAFLGTFLFGILFFRSMHRLLSDKLQEAIGRLLGKTLGVLLYPVTFAVKKIAAFLGIGRWRGWGEDERTFLWGSRRQEEGKKKRLKNEQKWADQPDNSFRIRYLYIDFMIKCIRNGFMFRRQLTPDEIAGEMELDPEEKLLFSTYDQARYAQNPDIPDAVVEKLRRAISRRHEIRKD